MASGLRGAPELVERKEEWDQEVMSALDREVNAGTEPSLGASFCGVCCGYQFASQLENRTFARDFFGASGAFRRGYV